MSYDPTAGSLTRQAWAYQQKLIDEMGEGLPEDWAAAGLGQVSEGQVVDFNTRRQRSKNPDARFVATCGAGFLAAGFAGYVAGKVGVLPTVIGVGIAYTILNGLDR